MKKILIYGGISILILAAVAMVISASSEDGKKTVEADSAIQAGGSAIFGRVYGMGTWISLTPTNKVLTNYTLTLPVDAYAYIEGSGYVNNNGANAESGFGLGIDSTSMDPATYRFIECPGTGYCLNSFQTSRVYLLKAGKHTINLIGNLGSGTGTEATVNYMSINILVNTVGAVTKPTGTLSEDSVAADGKK